MKALRRFSIVGLAKSPRSGEQEDEEVSGNKSSTSPGRISNPTSPPSPRTKKKALEVSDEKKTLNPLYRYNSKPRCISGGMTTLSSFSDDRKNSISRSSVIYGDESKLSPDACQRQLRAQTMRIRRTPKTTLPANEIFQKSHSAETPCATLNNSNEEELESPKSPKVPEISIQSPSPSDPPAEPPLAVVPPSRNIPTLQRSESFSYRRRSMSIDSFLHLQAGSPLKQEDNPSNIRNSDAVENSLYTRSLTHSTILTVKQYDTQGVASGPAMEGNTTPRMRRNTSDELTAPVVNLGELSPFDNDMSLRDQYTQEEGIIYKEAKDRENKRVVAGTLDRLISNLADGKPGGKQVTRNAKIISLDTEYICEFVLTRHYFMDAKTLLTKLLQRCNVEPPLFCTPEQLETFHSSVKVIKIRTINVLKKWMELRFSDFEDVDMEQMIFDFAENLGNDGESHRFWGDNLLKTYELHLMAQSMGELVTRGSQTPPKPILPTNLMPRLIRFLDLHPVEIARQMTLMENHIFSKVKIQEYFQQGWTKPELGSSPNVLVLIEDFNRMTYWAATEIVTAKFSKQAVTIARFIEVMENLFQLQNFHGVMIIFSALHMGSVQQLEKSWKDVPSRQMGALKAIGDLMSPSQNYKRYRETLKKATAPLIPFQVVLLSDFTAIDEIPTTLANGMQNFEKLRIIAAILSSLLRFQKIRYNFIEVPYIAEFWKISTVLTEKELYAQVKKSLHETSDDNEGTLSKFKTLMKKKREDT